MDHAKTIEGAATRRVNAKLVSVVIVNFNAGGFLSEAVESVLAQAELYTEIIIVDNSSSDASIAELRKRVPPARVRIIELQNNSGFAHACNIGIAESNADTVLLLNPDCRMRKGALALLKSKFSEEPEVGMIGPQLVNPDGSEQRGCRRDVPNPWQIFCVAIQLHRLMPNHPRFRSYNYQGTPMPDEPTEVPAISGACKLVRRETIDAVGQLDDQFFLHFADLDWCLRCEAAGINVLFVPEAVVEHTQGVCSASRPIRTEFYKHQSLIQFLRKHFTTFYPSSFMAIVTALVGLRFALVALGLIVRRRPSPTGAWEQIIRGPRAATERNGQSPSRSG